MGKKGKKKGGQQQQKVQKKKQQTKKKPSREEKERQKQIDSFEPQSNPYTIIVFKRLRNVKKRLTKIQTLKNKDLAELNEDQKRTLSDEPQILRLRDTLTSIQGDLILTAIKEAQMSYNGEEEEKPVATQVMAEAVVVESSTTENTQTTETENNNDQEAEMTTKQSATFVSDAGDGMDDMVIVQNPPVSTEEFR